MLGELRQWSQVPVIMLTVRDGEAEKVAALDGGANDYVTKPFGVQELMARVRALLRPRTAAGDPSPVFDDGVLRVDLALREVALRGEAVMLARKEYALLALLVQHSGRVVTQPQMLRELWGKHHEHDTHYLRVLVGKLRQKLGDDAAKPRWIVTETGVGLRFIGKSDAKAGHPDRVKRVPVHPAGTRGGTAAPPPPHARTTAAQAGEHDRHAAPDSRRQWDASSPRRKATARPRNPQV